MSERNLCDAANPMTTQRQRAAGIGARWQHPDARETGTASDHYIEYKCPHCGLVFRNEMPD